ncbi:A-kinase anchor protein 5 [Camelus dromedarius]|uniref:A-kinase anchor protein 5 n=3 Tax=Camelus TaxID=9836 RepID=A0A5N4E4E1_CAMDR|nr:A-kinase anchor protein 5 [Camelus bactrianus]XP_010974954.1 A-kinase anchor protein 5 [Camelus dromedarius]XP_032338072.1 A-kinase anchor protein 5 [Camelus ferus]EPY86168.1 a-kinase anchor protein 5-like protein [Camelus ferus]KAB1278207.1 A-kinase anchor protein 5 [Camelus dromedarius]
METTVSEIQVENKDEKRLAEVSPQEERQEEKASMLCFKRRKKAAKAMKPKAGSETADAARKCSPEAGASDQPQPPGGAWASIKRLVTRRKRSDSSKQQKSFEAEVQPEINAEDADPSKKKAKSRLKIPCIKFSKGEKRKHSKIIEDSDRSIKMQAEAESLDTKTLTQSDDKATKTKSTQDIREDVSQKEGDEVCESNVNNSITSGEKVILVELELDTGHSAIQTGTLILEKDIETIEEKQSVQPQQASPLETPDTECQLPVVSDVPPSPALPDQQIVEGARNDTLESGPNWKDHESRETVTEESEPKDTELSQESDFKENEITAEKPKPEESKRMEPIAIIITDTEISEFDVQKSKNVPKQFLISVENEQVGVFANDSGFEGRTSEQYETLLIETASSLVKNAIQLSIEQLVNEMASDDNTINNLLQ